MKVIIDSIERDLKNDGSEITRGKGRAEDKIVYKNEIDGSRYRFKSFIKSIFHEYIGLSAYQALSINVPKFNIGKYGEGHEEGKIIFVQEYLSNTEKTKISMCGRKLLEIELDNVIPIIVAIAILGDSNGIGREGNNILLEKKINTTNTTEKKLIKIDCDETFRCLQDREWSAVSWFNGKEKHPYNAIFCEFVEKYKENPQFISKASEYLAILDLNKFTEAVKYVFTKFNEIVSTTKGLKSISSQYKRDHYEGEEVGSICFLQDGNIKSIDMLCDRLKEQINNLIIFFTDYYYYAEQEQ